LWTEDYWGFGDVQRIAIYLSIHNNGAVERMLEVESPGTGISWDFVHIQKLQQCTSEM
jgi:hypothetical protein